jgi:O-antigen ligase
MALTLLLPAPLIGLVLLGGVKLYVAGPLLVTSFLGLLVLLARGFFGPSATSWRIAPGLLGLLLFGTFLFVVMPRGSVPHEALVEALKVAGCIGAYWAWTELSAVRGRWRIVLTAFLFVGMCMTWYALIQHAHSSRMVLWMERPEQYAMRASATFVCPNHLAQILTLLVVLGIAVAGIASAGWPLRIFAVYVALLALPVLVMTGSRSGWLGAVAGVGVTLALMAGKRSWRFLAVMVPFFLLAVVIVFTLLWSTVPVFKSRVQLAMQGDIRLPIWADTLDMIAEQPALGFGGGSYRWVFQRFQHEFRPRDTYARYAHNEYLHVAAEYGLVGAVLLFSAWIGFVVRLLGALVRARERKSICLITGLLGCMAAVTVHSFFDFNLHIFANAQVFALVTGTLSGALFVAGDLKAVRVPGWLSRAAASLGLVLVGVFVVITVRATVSYTYAALAEKARNSLDFDEALRKSEAAINSYGADWRGHVQKGHILKTRAFWERDPEVAEGLAREAVASYNEALARNPFDLYTKLELSRTYGDVLLENDQSEALLREIITMAPANFEFHGELGLRLRRMGRLDEAIDAFEAARKINPEDEMAILNLRSLSRMKRKQQVP